MTLNRQAQAQAQAQAHRISTCHRHPTKPVTGFCAPCLSERLAGLESAAADPAIPGSSGSELRRSKSCSGHRPESSTSDPTRRKSCDVRARSTLSELFNIDDDGGKGHPPRKLEVERRGEEEDDNGGGEARVSDLDSDAEMKTMKEFIDLELEKKKKKKKGSGRDLKEIAGTFWGTASGFSRKVTQWRRKQKPEKADGGERRRGTQSEVGEYALGRRSCDTDPDPGRMSLDEPHRASWDGYLGPRAHSNPRLTRMVSVVEESWERSPGGSAQTKDYYYSQRRRSFDRPAAAAAAEVDELKAVANARVSPATTELFYGAKLLITEKELMGSIRSNSNSKLKSDDECVESGVRMCTPPVCENAAPESTNGGAGHHQNPNRRHKKWSLWGLMQRRSEKKCVDEDSAESWQKLRRIGNVVEEANGSVSQKLIRSYSVSCRNSCKMVGLLSNVGGGVGVESKGSGLKSSSHLQRNKSARYSPSNLDHGLLRFYLTPLRSYRRSDSGKSRPKQS